MIRHVTRRCIRCGYVIDGLGVEGPCPECGLAILESYDPVRLGMWSVRDVRVLTMASALFIVWQGLLALLLIGVMVDLVMGFGMTLRIVYGGVAPLLVLRGVVLCVIGRLAPERHASSRALALPVLAALGGFLGILSMAPLAPLHPGWYTLVIVGGLVIDQFAFVEIMHVLATRMEADILASMLRRHRRWTPVVAILGFVPGLTVATLDQAQLMSRVHRRLRHASSTLSTSPSPT